MALNGRQIRHLRALGHHLHPVVLLGKDGLTDGVLQKVRSELLAHELIKVRLGEDKALAQRVATETRSELVQAIGKVALYYKRHPEDPKLELPK